MTNRPRGGGVPPNMKKLMQQAAEMQAEMQQRQAALSDATFEGSAGGGVVKAVVRGSGELVSVDIDPSVVDAEDTELLGDLVVAAVNQALGEMASTASASLGSVGGLDLSDLGGLIG